MRLVSAFAISVAVKKCRDRIVAAALLSLLWLVLPVRGQGAVPLVAVHDSELTRALETMPAVPPTPMNQAGTTGFQWWPTDWHYFVMPETMKEVLRSDGTAFTTLGDSNIVSGALLTNGQPRYPIVISLSSEAIQNEEIAQFTNYVAAGGFLLVGGSAFTRDTNGNTLGDFAFANQMGTHMLHPSVANYGVDNNLTVQGTNRLTAHIPTNTVTWRLATYSEEINWGTSPYHNYLNPHDFWQVTNTDSTVLAMGDTYPYITLKQYGKGYFIYIASFNAQIGHGGFAPTMYSYLIFRRAIEWAFQNQNLPVPKLSPWPYNYDAAFMMRHDLEDYADEVTNIEASAQVEATNGVKGDYYFCTGVVRQDMPSGLVNVSQGPAGWTYDTNVAIASLRRAISNYGATIGSHNGGLSNLFDPLPWTETNYDYWHWAMDEVLDGPAPAGFANGTNYAFASLSNSLADIDAWLPGQMTNGRIWCAPYFNATRDASYQIQASLNVKIDGEQKIGPFPHWLFSTQTPGKRYGILSEPVSDWYVSNLVAQSLEPWHFPGIQTTNTLHNAIDFYYSQGFLVNFYSHTMTTGYGPAGGLTPECMSYSINTNLHPRLWLANGMGVYNWWMARSNAQISVGFSTNGNESLATISIAGATDPNTAVEVLVPGTNSYCSVQVLTNGVFASTNNYRTNGQLVRVLVGTTVTNVLIGYYPMTNGVCLCCSVNTNPPVLPGQVNQTINEQTLLTVTNTATDVDPVTYALVSPPAGAAIDVNGVITWTPSQTQAPGTNAITTIATDVAYPSLSATNSFTVVVNDLNQPPVLPVQTNRTTVGLATLIVTNTATDPDIHVTSLTYALQTGPTNAVIDTNGVITWTPVPAQIPGTNLFTTVATDFDPYAVNSQHLSATNTFTVTVNSHNGPSLPAQASRTVNELTLLTVTNTATDTDYPPLTLTYQLVNPPAGASISTNGVITWTPSEAQAPGTNMITTTVTDNGAPNLSSTNSFTVVVNDVNLPPVLPVQANRTNTGLAALVVTNTATESDTPPDPLTYVLQTAPTNAVIDTNGVITWTPVPAQVPSTNVFTTVVTDFDPDAVNSQHLSATNSFIVVQKAIHNGPSLSAQPNRTNNPQMTLVVTNTATDNDVPALALTYQLVGPPLGAVINTNGVITFSPPGLPTVSTNVIKTLVTDNGTPSLGASNTFSVVVNASAQCQYTGVFQQNFDTNTAPALPSGWTTAVTGVGVNWITQTTNRDTVPNAAYTPDVGNVATADLVSPTIALPSGPNQLVFRNSYNLEWNTNNTTDGYDGGVLEIKIGTNAFVDIITAGGSFASGGYNRTIDPNWQNPLINRPAWSGNSGGFITTSVYLPPSASGQNVQLRWRMGADNGNVASGVSGWWIDSIGISNLVCSAAGPPVLPAQANRTVNEMAQLSVTNTATDTNVNPNSLTYQLVSPPSGMVIDTNGVITWTPAEGQGPHTNVITTIVQDAGAVVLSATNSFSVVVNDVNLAPVLPAQADRTIVGQTPLTVTNTASDPNIPATTLTYGLTTGPTGASISTNGVITWTPAPAQVPSTNLFTTVVTNFDPNAVNSQHLTATNSFTVVVNAIRNGPSLPAQTNYTVTELSLLTVTNTASDSDLPPPVLAYQLVSPPSGVNIDTNGVITWTPAGGQGPATNLITTIVTDNGSPVLSATNSFLVTVNQLLTPPQILSIKLTNGVAYVTWTAIAGHRYWLQYKDGFITPNWTNMVPDVLATGSTATATNNAVGAPTRLYRVLLNQQPGN